MSNGCNCTVYNSLCLYRRVCSFMGWIWYTKKVIKLSSLFAGFTPLEQLKVTSTQTAELSCMKMLHIGKTICTFSFTYVGMVNALKFWTFFSLCSQIKFQFSGMEKEPVANFNFSMYFKAIRKNSCENFRLSKGIWLLKHEVVYILCAYCKF